MKKDNFLLRKLIREEIKNILLKEVKIVDYAITNGIEVGLTVNFKFGLTGTRVNGTVSKVLDDYIEVQVKQPSGDFFAVQITNPKMAQLRSVKKLYKKQIKSTSTSEE